MSTISKSLRMQMRPIDHVDTPPGQTNNVAQRPSHSGSREPAETSPGIPRRDELRSAKLELFHRLQFGPGESIPEPSTWVMMILGIGVMAYRRKPAALSAA